MTCSRSAARRSAAGTRSPRLSCLLTLCLGSPEPLGGVKRSGAFADSGHPAARCALPACLGFPAGPGEGAREAVDGKVQGAENPREGRGQNRRSPRPSSRPCATAQEVEEAAGPVLHGAVFRDCS